MNKYKIDELLAVSWSGSLSALVLNHISTIATIICIFLSCIASIYAISVSRSTVKLRTIETAEKERELCDKCRDGDPPNTCPIPKHERPRDCPNYQNDETD